LFLILLNVFLAWAAKAQAQTVYNMKFDLKPYAPTVQLSYGSFQNTWAYAGAFSASWVGDQPTNLPSVFDTYCVDVGHENGLSDLYSVTPEAVNAFSSPEMQKIAYLYNTYSASASNAPDQSAALQIAMWDILSGNGDFDVTTGNGTTEFKINQASNNIITLANSYLSEGISGSIDGTWLNATHGGDHNQLYQDMIGPAATLVPEPSALALLLPGLAALGLAKRRKR
jgi:hypothetical protein